jgi:DNA polymerase-3 subunit alpha/error-prone DNA polymerase
MGFYSSRALVSDAQRHQVRFVALCVQYSDYDYTLSPPANPTHDSEMAIRVGLRSIFGLAEKFAQVLIEERSQHGLYLSLHDFIRRTQLPRSIYVRLAAAGAFACFDLNARDALWTLQSICLDSESLIFGEPYQHFATPHEKQDFHHIPSESTWEEMRREYHTKGFSIDHHPMGILRSEINRLNLSLRQQRRLTYFTTEQILQLPHKKRVRVAGLLSIQQRPPTAKGVSFLTLEDEFGVFNIILPATVYETYRLVLTASPLLEVQGTLEKKSGVYQIQAVSVRPLDFSHREMPQLSSHSIKARLFSL